MVSACMTAMRAGRALAWQGAWLCDRLEMADGYSNRPVVWKGCAWPVARKSMKVRRRSCMKDRNRGPIVQHFKDDTTAFNAEKKTVIEGKGVLNNRLSEFFMTGLNNIGVPTHFIKRLNMREQLIRQAEIIPARDRRAQLCGGGSVHAAWH